MFHSSVHQAWLDANLSGARTLMDQNPRDDFGRTPLMEAVELDQPEYVEFLLQAGAKVGAQSHQSHTALMTACQTASLPIITLLIEASLILESRSHIQIKGTQPGSNFYRAGEKTAKRILNAQDADGVTCMAKAAEAGRLDVMELLRKYGATLEHIDEHGFDLLMWAALGGHLDVVKFVVAEQPDSTQYVSSRNETALQKAAACGHLEVANYLISEAKVKVNQTDSHLQSALSWAVHRDQVEMVKLLLGKGCAFDKYIAEGLSILHIACVSNSFAVFTHLLTMMPPKFHDQADENGYTPLHYGAESENPGYIECLLKLSVNLNAKTHTGHTPLILAAKRGQHANCLALLKKQADFRITNDEGHEAAFYLEGLQEMIDDLDTQSSG